MRGRRAFTVAVRAPDGEVVVHRGLLNPAVYRARWSKIPFLRGLVLLWDALALGIKALLFSADVALGEEAEFKGATAWFSVGLGLLLGVGIFFLVPAVVMSFLDRYVTSAFVSNLLEGLLRLGMFIGYVALIGLWPDVRRVFAYHGAEHKVINAYEAGEPLELDRVRRYSTAHTRCGTTFILWVVLISVLVFALLGRPPLPVRFLSRILLIPVIVMLSYELLRFGSSRRGSFPVRLLLKPALALQNLTTREPDDEMLQVALTALRALLEEEAREGEMSG